MACFPTPPLAALLTPRGRGAVAAVAYAGDAGRLDGLFTAAAGRPLSDQPVGRVAFGRWEGPDEAGEEVVVCRVEADRLEIHCHGGEAAARRILSQLAAAGAAVLPWQAWTAAVDGPFAAAAAAALAAATTPRTAAIVTRQTDGPLRASLLRLAAADPAADGAAVAAELDALLRWAEFGAHLTRPWTVVLCGRPNAGKSSLINALAGYERAIVSAVPGTTRDVLTVETAFAGWPVRLSDTAGLRVGADDLEAEGVARATAALAAADLRLLVLDRARPPQIVDFALPGGVAPHLIVWNKCDLPDARDAASEPAAPTLEVSAATGAGLAALTAAIAAALVPSVPPPDAAVPFSARQVEALHAARAAVRMGDAAAYRAALRPIAPAEA